MGINKDPNYSAQNTVAGIRANELFLSYSEHDKKLIQKIIEEVNSKEYFIQYLFQLSWMDKDDFEFINPIIMKYSLQFERKNTKYGLFGYLGVKGNTDATDFLLVQFRKSNDYIDNLDWNFSRRGVCSSALLVIKDKSKIDEYIEIIESENTRQDSHFFILLLGELKVEKSIPLLIELLSEDNIHLQSAAIQSLTKNKKKIDLNPIIAPFLSSDNDAIRGYAKKALK